MEVIALLVTHVISCKKKQDGGLIIYAKFLIMFTFLTLSTALKNIIIDTSHP
jgi:hypothetical protein